MNRMTKKLERAYFNALKAAAKSVGSKKVPLDLRERTKADALDKAKGRLKDLKSAIFSTVAKGYNVGKEPKISAEADELLLYADNDEPTYRITKSVQKNLAKKMRDGLYSHKMAEKAWLYVADHASQRYKKEIGSEGIDSAHRGSGSYAHNTATRREVASYMAWRFVRWAQQSEYDNEDWAR